MNWQSKEQLGMEYILHAWAAVIDDHAVEMAGERFLQTLNSLAAPSQARPGQAEGHCPAACWLGILCAA